MKFKKDLEEISFKFNDYDPCIANRMVNGKQHTVRFHVDDLLSSHVDPKVNDRFAQWLEKMYGKYKDVEPTRGKIHDYLGMVVDFTEKGKVIIDMVKYVESMIDDFPVKLNKGAKIPAALSRTGYRYWEIVEQRKSRTIPHYFGKRAVSL